eukprot:412390-Rhodomonas_salina.1
MPGQPRRKKRGWESAERAGRVSAGDPGAVPLEPRRRQCVRRGAVRVQGVCRACAGRVQGVCRDVCRVLGWYDAMPLRERERGREVVRSDRAQASSVQGLLADGTTRLSRCGHVGS